MAQITTDLIKKLRETAGAGMMDCKKALVEVDGDFDAAVDWLRTNGLAAAAKKASRVASEGLVVVATNGTTGAVTEINSETDFVSKNEQFQNMVAGFGQLALSANGDVDALANSKCPETGKKASEVLTDTISVIGENMNLRRTATLSVSDGIVAKYVHNAAATDMGKIGVLVALESTGDKAKLETLGKQLAMHVAAIKPESLSTEDLDPALIERERNVLAEQAKASGKPAEIIEKMMIGRMQKYYKEVVFLEQPFVIDGKTRVADVVAEAAKDLGAEIKITGFVCFTLGEGIEKEESDFASEVAAAVNG